MTLRELDIYAEGLNDRDAEGWRQRISIAHLTASLGRAKKIPKLSTLLPRPTRRAAPQGTPQQRREAFWDMAKVMARKGELGTIKKSKK